jgi:hypothetical protein
MVSALATAKTLDMYVIDVGGKALLFVSPSGQSLLFDAGVGTVDLYVTANHGIENANSPVMVHALRPRGAIMDNQVGHGGSAEAFQTVESSLGLEDFWQSHYSPANGEKANVSPDYIANMEASPGGKWIKISVERDGTFSVTNTRNNFSKTYKPRK